MTHSTSTGKVALAFKRQVSLSERIRSTHRLPFSLWVPRLRFRQSTPKRSARSARLLVRGLHDRETPKGCRSPGESDVRVGLHRYHRVRTGTSQKESGHRNPTIAAGRVVLWQNGSINCLNQAAVICPKRRKLAFFLSANASALRIK